MLRKFVFIIAGCFLFPMVTSFAQTNYYVSSSQGIDSNNGLSPDQALKTLSIINLMASNGIIKNGDSLLFKRGDIWEGEFLDFSVGMPTLAGAPIVISSYGSGELPIFSGRPDTSLPDPAIAKGIIITTPSFIIQNIEIKNYSKDGINANVNKSNDLNVTIDNVYIHHTGSDLFTYTYGIYLEGKNTKILNSQITYNDNDGVYILGANPEIGFCTFLNNGTGLYGDEIQLARCDNFWVHDNFLSNAGGDHGTFITKLEFQGGIFERNYCYGDSWGCAIGGSNAIVRNNYFIDNRGFAIDVRGYNTTVYNNVIQNTKYGIQVSGPRENRDGGITKIYNNTILNISKVSLDFDNSLDPDSTRIIYSNNIISGIQQTAIQILGNSRILTNSGDYNLFYPDSLQDMFIYFNSTPYESLKKWQKRARLDRHSVVGDPLLDGSYCPQSGSPVISKALNLHGVDNGLYNFDIRGIERSAIDLWDIGVCESPNPITSVIVPKLLPSRNYLNQNYPNPFNPSTVISYTIPFEGSVRVRVFNMLGEMVSELVNQTQSQGEYEAVFDGSNLASGMYFYSIEAVSFDGSQNLNEVKKMLLQK